MPLLIEIFNLLIWRAALGLDLLLAERGRAEPRLDVQYIPFAHVPLARTQSHGPVQMQGRLLGRQHFLSHKWVCGGPHPYLCISITGGVVKIAYAWAPAPEILFSRPGFLLGKICIFKGTAWVESHQYALEGTLLALPLDSLKNYFSDFSVWTMLFNWFQICTCW